MPYPVGGLAPGIGSRVWQSSRQTADRARAASFFSCLENSGKAWYSTEVQYLCPLTRFNWLCYP